MAHNEKLQTKHEHGDDHHELERLAQEQRETIREKLEKNHEDKAEKLEDITREAIEKAHTAEKETAPHKREKITKAERRGIPSKKERDISYKRTMTQVQTEMSVPSRAFSKIIHVKPVEKTSEVVGSTIARPNAILAGSFMAFVFTLVIFLIARYYGYPLSGAETIAGFIIGWSIGVLFDYVRVMVTGKRS